MKLALDQNVCVITATLCIFSALITQIAGVQLKLSENYLLDYNITDDCTSIDFIITAINVTGWVGLGLNNKSADMDGADLLIAGYHTGGSGYYFDYYGPVNAGDTPPVRDRLQNWYAAPSEIGSDTRVRGKRKLATGDTQEDVEIKDEPIHLLWAYSRTCDFVTCGHTHSGSLEVNLLAGSECQTTTEPPTEDTEPPTVPPPTTTEPTPGICPPTGVELVEHPTSCSLYYICAEGTAIEQECGDGLHFNPATKQCDFPENVNCTKPLPECPPEGVILLPYPGNCSLYVICVEGTPSVWSCATGTCFDPVELKCLSNETAIWATPSQVDIEEGSDSYFEAVSRCSREKLQDIILVGTLRSPQEFYICYWKEYKATLTCPDDYVFNYREQHCVPEPNI